MKTRAYLAIDGNQTGRYLEKYILCNDMAGLRQFNDAVFQAVRHFESIIQNGGGIIYMSGGDNILAEVDLSPAREIHHALSVHSVQGYSFSMALADSPQDAYIGLKYAKCSGEKSIRVLRTADNRVTFEKYEGE